MRARSGWQRILVTRPADQAWGLCDRLRAIGIEAIAVPTVAILPPPSFDALDDALRDLEEYDWVIFTSVNGVESFFGRRKAIGLGQVVAAKPRWAAIGPATASAISAHGISSVWVPTRYLSEAVAEELPDVAGRRILRVRADLASPLLSERLRARGALLDEVIAYRTVEAPPGAVDVLREAFATGIDGVIFTSASTVRGFARLVGATGLGQLLPDLRFIAIGPVTAQAIEAMGWRAHMIAEEHSTDGLVRLLQERREDNAPGVQ